ncbi:MAG: hypothetical protein ACTS46_02005 [Candidatus Hodgkinia cicadicola]
MRPLPEIIRRQRENGNVCNSQPPKAHYPSATVAEDSWEYILTLTTIWIIEEVKGAIDRYRWIAKTAAKVSSALAAVYLARLAFRI